MGRVFDEKDYQQRLDQLDTSNITLGDELSDIGEGWVSGTGSGPLDARKDILIAKQNALRKARKAMINAIRAAERDQRFNSVLPIEVEEIATGSPGEELVKVP